MALFYSENINQQTPEIILDEDTSRHIVQVLRMKKNDSLQLTDGLGNIFTTTIVDDHKKKVKAEIHSKQFTEREGPQISIGISLIKNNNRFEWFLEKVTEIGVTNIIPMHCERTERQHFRTERMKSILVSAMLQSNQAWLPNLEEPISFEKIVSADVPSKKLIAHCLEGQKKDIANFMDSSDAIILIGPEGDFTQAEIDNALKSSFVPVTLGNTRLRTETAGVVAATLLKLPFRKET